MPQPLRRSPKYRWRAPVTPVTVSGSTAPPSPSHIRAPHSLDSRLTVYYNDNTIGDAPHYVYLKQSAETIFNVVGIIGKKEDARFRFSLHTTTPSTVSWNFGFTSYNSTAVSSMLSVTL